MTVSVGVSMKAPGAENFQLTDGESGISVASSLFRGQHGAFFVYE